MFTSDGRRAWFQDHEAVLDLKSLSPIHFVKIRLYNFLGIEFIVKMYKL